MLIRRLPQPTLTRKCITFIFGQKAIPVIETVNVVQDNLQLGYRVGHHPEAFEHAINLYRVRYVSDYQRAYEKAMRPEKKDQPEANIPTHFPGMVRPSGYSRVTN